MAIEWIFSSTQIRIYIQHLLIFNMPGLQIFVCVYIITQIRFPKERQLEHSDFVEYITYSITSQYTTRTKGLNMHTFGTLLSIPEPI